jgi:hypothetical protein
LQTGGRIPSSPAASRRTADVNILGFAVPAVVLLAAVAFGLYVALRRKDEGGG